MRLRSRVRRITALILIISLFSGISVPDKAKGEDFLSMLFGSFSSDGYDEEEIAYYDDDGYPVYLDGKTGYYYGLYDDDTAYIMGYSGTLNGSALVIPASAGGYPVYNIAEEAFMNVKGVSSITVSEGISEIYYTAFMNCDLKYLTLPKSVRIIGYSAFEGCTSLREINFSEGLETVGDCAFASCSALRSAMLPESVTEMGWGAFSCCTSMTKARIGSKLSSMDGNAFNECPNLTLEVSEKNPVFVQEQGLLFNKERQSLVRYDADERNETSFTVPDGVREIEYWCFGETNALTSVILSDDVEVLKLCALWGCVNLQNIHLARVREIEKDAVVCNALYKVALPDTITYMDDQAFCLRSDIFDPGGEHTAYVNSGTYAYDAADRNGFVMRPMSEYADFLEKAKVTEPSFVIEPDYIYAGEEATFILTYEDAQGTVEFNMEGETVGITPFMDGVADFTAKIEREGVFTVTAILNNESIAMARVIVTVPGKIPEVRLLDLPCYHEAGHSMRDPRVKETYRADSDAFYHIRRTEKRETWVCTRCGMFMIDEPVSTIDTREMHSFVNGICACGVKFEDRYRLKIDEKYVLNGEYYVRKGDAVYVEIIDTVTNEIVENKDILKITMESPDGAFVQTNKALFSAEHNGAGEMVLYCCGVETDREKFYCTTLETGGRFSGAATRATDVVVMDDMDSVEWSKKLMSINNRVKLENYRAKKVNDEYEVTFTAYNSSPMAFGVYAYDRYGNVCDRQYIAGSWYNASVLEAAGDVVEGLEKLIFEQRDGMITAGDAKSEISLTVPKGGYIRFMTAADDDLIKNYNTYLLIAGIIGSSMDTASSAINFNSALNGSAQISLLQGLKDLDLFDLYDVISDTSEKTLEEILAEVVTEEVVTTVADIIVSVFGKAAFSKIESTVLNIITLGANEGVDFFGNLIGGIGSFELMRKDLKAAYTLDTIVYPEYILFPVK